jgi:drug/metabolite transporter (DMT)-like permease
MTPSPSPRERRLAYLSWIAVCLIWGTTYLGIRVSLETMPPALMGGLRWLIAGGLLTFYLVARGERLPPPSRWGGIVLMAFLLLGLGNGGVVVAEQWVPSGLTAVLIATSPFWMAAVEACFRDGERLTRSAAAGLIVGFLGIVVLVWPELSMTSASSRLFLVGIVSIQIASLGWSLGSAYSRRHTRQDHVLGTTALQMLAGGILMTAAGTVLGEWRALSFTTRTATALIYLSTIGAIGGFVAYTYALRHLPVAFVSLYAYINPVIAVALGVAVLGEPFNSRMAIAAALVFAGVAIVRGKPAANGTEPASVAKPPGAPVPVPAGNDARPSERSDPLAASSEPRRIA